MADIPVFNRFEVYYRMRGGALLAWDLHPMFRSTGPLTFRVMVSRTTAGAWETVTTVTDQYIAEDPNWRLYGKAPRLYYRIRMTADGVNYDSEDKQMVGNLSDHDLPIYREIIRKETLRLQKYAGMCGYLYKRKRWGTQCPTCLDYDTGEVKNAHCPDCFGTGFVAGYFDPLVYWVADSTQGVNRRTTTQPEGQGVIEDRVRPVRALNCPWLDTGDVWIKYDSDQRYIVQRVKEINFRDIPFIFDPVELRLAPTTDIVYSLERPEDHESSSS